MGLLSILDVFWTNVVIGVLAGLVVTFASTAKDRAQDKYLEFRYPLSGKYISRFEEEHTDESVKTAPVKVTQRGRNVYGKSREPGGSREWTLEGELVEERFINGFFRTADPHSGEIGNFFLYVNPDRTIEGHWSGSPDDADGVSYGVYELTPVLESYEVEPLTEETAPAALDLAERHFRDGFEPTEFLRRARDGEDGAFAEVAVLDEAAVNEQSRLDSVGQRLFDRNVPASIHEEFDGLQEESRVIGFVAGGVVSQDELCTELGLDAGTLPACLRGVDRIGLVRGVAVREEFQHRGVGTALVKSCLERCERQGATVCCALDWRADGDGLGGILEYLGFEERETYDGHWSMPGSGRCPHCESGGCDCAGVLFTKV